MGTARGLRIGELAALAGVSARAVRHYHRAGVLPEPPRRPNGYRVYGLVDVVRLLRVRRLVELGLPLSDVTDALAGPAVGDVRELLTGLAEDLREQERSLARRRQQVDDLLAEGGDPARSERLTAVVATLGDGPQAEREALVAELLDHVTEDFPQIARVYGTVGPDDGASDELWAAFADLAGLAPDDLAVEDVARRAAEWGEQAFGDLAGDAPAEGDPVAAARVEQAVTADLDPAQARCVRLMFALIRERTA